MAFWGALLRRAQTVSRETLLFPVHLYRWLISPLLPSRCRYHPSCSAYAVEAVRRRGIVGVVLAAWRILRCNPWSEGGFDPVPAAGWKPTSSDEAELRARHGRCDHPVDTPDPDTD